MAVGEVASGVGAAVTVLVCPVRGCRALVLRTKVSVQSCHWLRVLQVSLTDRQKHSLEARGSRSDCRQIIEFYSIWGFLL